MLTAITPTPLQARILEIPASWSIAECGGRGGGKTYSVILLGIRHLAQYGDAAKILLVRESYKSLSQVEELTVSILEQAFPGRVKFSRQEHIVRIDGGGTWEFGQLESPRDVNKYLGREVTLLVIDELGLLKESKWVTLLKSNLRSPSGVPLRTVQTCNPGGNLHQFIFKNFVAGRLPWHPYEFEGETFVTVPSSVLATLAGLSAVLLATLCEVRRSDSAMSRARKFSRRKSLLPCSVASSRCSRSVSLLMTFHHS
jgi:hypothetical protein